MTKDTVSRWFVNHLPPRIIYFAAIRLMAFTVSQPEYRKAEVPAVSGMDAIGTWEKAHGL